MPIPSAPFVCRRCGTCCRVPGPVRLRPEEVDALAAARGLAPEVFLATHTRLTDDRRGLSLTERPDGACILLDPDDRTCLVQNTKPTQCRDFPSRWTTPLLNRLCPALSAGSPSR